MHKYTPFSILWIALTCLVLPVHAQPSCTVTAPATLTGYRGQQYSVNLTNAPNVTRVQYITDAYPNYNPGLNAGGNIGTVSVFDTRDPHFPLPINSFWTLNGPRLVIANAYDALGSLVTSCNTTGSTTANAWPQSWNPGMTVTTGTPLTSNWTGGVSVTATYTGTGTADSKSFYFFIDGILQIGLGGTAASQSWTYDTTQFPDGQHIIGVTSTDATGATHYTDGNTVDASTEWTRVVTFSNTTALTNYAVTSANDIYIAPTATYTLTGHAVEGNGTASTATSVYFSDNTAVATVNASTGLITGVANGNAHVYAMAPITSVTDLSNLSLPNTVNICSASFSISNKGELINITGGSGVIAGVYLITSLGTNQCGTTDRSWNNANVSAGVGSFGPTRKDNVFVWPTNTMPCLGSDGTQYSSYNAACSPFHSTFSIGIRMLGSDKPFYPGSQAEFSAGAIHTFEPGIVQNSLTGTESPTGQAAYQTAETSYVSNIESMVSSWPRLDFYLIGDQIDRNDIPTWAATNGPAGQWTIPPLVIGLTTWNGYHNIRGIAMYDEVGSTWGAFPLQGPITFGSSTQSWLTSITADGMGNCTAATTAGSQSPFSVLPTATFNTTHNFVIHGSSVTNMNSVSPNVYTAMSLTGTGFTFACTGVAAGTYNASNDSGLVLEPYAVRWNNANSTPPYGYVDSTAFAQLRKQYNNSGVPFAFEFAPAGTNTIFALQNWGGNSSQTNSGISQVSNIADLYPPQGSSAYLISRISLTSAIAPNNPGGWVRGGYGYYNPTLPIVMITEGVPTAQYGVAYGVQGLGATAPVVVSCVGNTITFSAPVYLANILPGDTKMQITGATDSGSPQDSCNNNFLIEGHPTPTTFTVALQTADFVGNATGGTVNWSGGGTTALTSITANAVTCTNTSLPGNGTTTGSSGQLGILCGERMFNSSHFPASTSMHRGQTFNVTGTTGTGSANFASGTFVYDISNPDTNFSGSTTTWLFYHQIPSLNATGGAANIVRDMDYIKGRNASMDIATSGEITAGDTTLDFAFASSVECMYRRCSGERIYQGDAYHSGFSQYLGFTQGDVGNGPLNLYSDTTISSWGQTYMNEHFEMGNTVSMFHAHNIAALMWNRTAKYWEQPRLNSPDYGPYLDCAAAQGGGIGAIMSCMNITDGPESATFSLSAYETAGQQLWRVVYNKDSISATTVIAAGTASDTLTLQSGDVVLYAFPVTFAGELTQPLLATPASAITGTTDVVLQYAYDWYYLNAAPDSFDCGSTGACGAIPADLGIGNIYYRWLYRGSSGQLLASGQPLCLQGTAAGVQCQGGY